MSMTKDHIVIKNQVMPVVGCHVDRLQECIPFCLKKQGVPALPPDPGMPWITSHLPMQSLLRRVKRRERQTQMGEVLKHQRLLRLCQLRT